MKKKLLIILLAAVLTLLLSVNVLAQETNADADIKEYVLNRIAPVVAGVLTAVVALLSTIAAVSKSLSSLKETKDAFKKETSERIALYEKTEQLLQKRLDEVLACIENIPELKEMVKRLSERNLLMAQILSLGFSSNAEVIESGKGREMAILLDKIKKSSPEGGKDEKA